MSEVRCVFVHHDRAVELKWLPAEGAGLPTFCIPRPVPTTRWLADFDDPTRLPMDIVDAFIRQGKTYAGFPVFCIDTLDVREVGCDHYLSKHEYHASWKEDEPLFNMLRNEAFRHALNFDSDARVLDRWTGEAPLPLDGEQMHIIGRRVRLLVIVRKA